MTATLNAVTTDNPAGNPAPRTRAVPIGSSRRPVTVPAEALFTAVDNVLPFTAGIPADLAPLLAAVRIEVPADHPRDVDVVATDRYRLGWHRILGPACPRSCGQCDTCQRTTHARRHAPTPAPVAAFGVTLDARELRAALSVFGRDRHRRDPRVLTVTRTGHTIQLACDTPHLVAVTLTESHTAGGQPRFYPDWRRLITTLTEHPGQPGNLAVRPGLLATFARVRTSTGRGAPMRLRFHHGPTDPAGEPTDSAIRLDIDGEFTGLVMPFRLPA